jgi:uridine kinase
MENGFKKKCLVFGLGGISRAGKSTLRKALTEKIKPDAIFHIDDYLLGPIKKFDSTINDYIEDWEDPCAYDLERFFQELKSKKEELEKDLSQNSFYILAEGFLLYFRKDIADLIDLKMNFEIEKEVCRKRRKNTKHYVSDYYFDEYIWKCYHENK